METEEKIEINASTTCLKQDLLIDTILDLSWFLLDSPFNNMEKVFCELIFQSVLDNILPF
jgi:hypothetical protein